MLYCLLSVKDNSLACKRMLSLETVTSVDSFAANTQTEVYHAVIKFLLKLKAIKTNITIPLTEKPFLESFVNNSFFDGDFTGEICLSQTQTFSAKGKKIP